MPFSEMFEYLMNSLSCVTYNGAQHSSIIISEKDCQAKLKKVKIKANSGNWFCFSPDDGRKFKVGSKVLTLMSPLLICENGYHHHCACDAVIIMENENKLNIIYIDLKSNNPTGYSNQFKSTRQFVRYLLSLQEEFQENRFDIENERYIIFFNELGYPKKRTTTPKHGSKVSKPDKACKIPIKENGEIYLKAIL